MLRINYSVTSDQEGGTSHTGRNTFYAEAVFDFDTATSSFNTDVRK